MSPCGSHVGRFFRMANLGADVDMTNYAKGARLERELKEKLERDGYYVIRAAGSHGLFDLIAWNFRSVMLVQCKTRKPTKDELRQMYSIPSPNNFQMYWAVRKNRKEWVLIRASQGGSDCPGEVVPV